MLSCCVHAVACRVALQQLQELLFVYVTLSPALGETWIPTSFHPARSRRPSSGWSTVCSEQAPATKAPRIVFSFFFSIKHTSDIHRHFTP